MNEHTLHTEIAHLKQELELLQQSYKDLQTKYTQAQETIAKLQGKDGVINSSGVSHNKRFKMVTVMFAHIVGFQKLEHVDDPEKNVDELDSLYIELDSILEKYNIKKIKSLGDTYMYAGGIPKKNKTNPIEVVRAAMEILRFFENKQKHEGKIWDICLGIHTGPVQASISGKKKNIYELKGDAVNIASRIEAYSNPGKLILSEMTYEFVRDFFICDKIGEMPVKYTGVITMYELIGFKPKYSDDDLLWFPNDRFHIKFGHVRFFDLEEYVLNRLEKELPNYLTYHNVKHTMDVLIGVEVIGTAEQVSSSDMLLLKTAALFHDMGHIVQAKNHENISCDFAHSILPHYDYTPKQINTICEIIMATQLPPQPQNLLEEIMCDADLDYLGRSDFIPVSDTLYDELFSQKIIRDKNEWNKLQIKFISGHHYFTNFAKNNREVNKQKQISRLRRIITD
ncbi:MAG: adenylate/guanylate cyclase domain-containing protein [Bacteroidota bacterium]